MQVIDGTFYLAAVSYDSATMSGRLSLIARN